MNNLLNIFYEFDKYANSYDMDDPKIALKYFHSYRVMQICRQIADDIGLNEEDTYLAMVIGLLHDFARFKQWKEFKTYSDDNSIDHGDLAVKLLFEDNEIEKFNIDKKYYDIIYESIKYHNKYGYPENTSDKSKLFCKLIKDADKLDIFYLISTGEIKVIDDNSEISQAISDEFYQGKLLRKENRKTKSDLILFYLAMIFDMNFKYSYKYLRDNRLIEGLFKNIEKKEKFQPYLEYINKYMKEGNKEYVRKKI